MAFHSNNFLYVFLMTLFVAACGGGGSNKEPDTQSGDVFFLGNVIDGYVAGATVCLDLNANGRCDVGEPQTISEANGAFKLNVKNASTKDLYILAEIPDSAKDSDDEGKTLAQAGKSGYTMATPSAFAGIVSPFTTLAVGKMQKDGLSFADAKGQVLLSLGLPSDTDILQDHVKADNGVVRATARQIATQLQQAQSALTTGQVSDRLKAINDIIAKKRDGAGTIITDRNTRLLGIPSSISNSANGSLLFYKIPSTRTGELITASAMVFTPKAAAPTGGRSMIVFAHGTTGVSSKCAPSNIMQSGNGYAYADLVVALVNSGYVVVAPDYEGRGPDIPDGHPYLHVASAGNSMALAAVAAKKSLGASLSGAWAIMGHSQGGHAALAGAQFAGLASQIESSLRYKGAVAIAPASNLSLALDNSIETITKATAPAQFQKAYEALGILNFYSSYVAKGSDYTIEPLPVDTVFGERLRALHKASAGDCLDAYYATVQRDISDYAMSSQATLSTPAAYKGVIAEEFRKPSVQRMLRSLEPGTVRLPGDTLIIQGLDDTTVLPATTEKLTALMRSNQTVVTLKTYEKATHSGVLAVPAAQQDMFSHLMSIFKP